VSNASLSTYLYLSPHFDDVALSCGGCAALDAQTGHVTVATVFAGQPDGELNEFARFQHDRWGTGAGAVDERRLEDASAVRALGAHSLWLDFGDAIYRGDLYLSDLELFGPVKPEDAATASVVQDSIRALVEKIQPVRVYAPLGVGGHVDHRLVRDAAMSVSGRGTTLYLYEDIPYAAARGAVEEWIADSGLKLVPIFVDVSVVMPARLASIAAYATQLPTIFRNFGPWESVVRTYHGNLSERPGRYVERLWVPAS
jgi:LmbE family N-acetylglucosaminyl deacetylase